MTETRKRSQKPMVKLLRFIGTSGARVAEAGARVAEAGDGVALEAPDGVALEAPDGRTLRPPAALIGEAIAAGLIADGDDAAQPSETAALPAMRDGRRRLTLLPAARGFLRRAAAEAEEAFLAQHADIASVTVDVEGRRQPVRIDRSESPLSALARLKDRNGAAFLPAEALAAGERLAADFTRGQLQPRVTASWQPRLSSAAKGGRGGMADLADSAMAARLAVNRAAAAMGPELSGVALDICCFMKGLALVERERQWPARSAKLMLRTALMALSRHYAPPRPEKPPGTRHWGAEGYRPDWG